MKEKIREKNNFTKLTLKEGISLIVLIITIIVIIILAIAIILTLNKNNLVESARETKFKEDVRNFQYALNLSISKDYTARTGQRDYKFSATTLSDIQKYIPSFTKEYEGKLIIENDEIVYVDVNLNNKELQWLNELEIKNNISQVLPKEYQKVEYIESHGTEYIDSKVIPITGEKCSINIDFQLTKLIDNTWICGFFGDTSGVLECGIWSKNFYNRQFSYSQVSDCFERTTATGVGNKNDLKYSILIFARMSHTLSDYRPANVKVYSAQISIDDILVRDFIPCYRKSDGEGGLYDKVTKQFYTNKGTGTFTYKVK